MSHLDEGTLHALLDGELETTEVAEIQAHLGSCSACGLRLREAKDFLGAADRMIATVDPGAIKRPPAPQPQAEASDAAPPRVETPFEAPAPRPRPRPRPPLAEQPPVIPPEERTEQAVILIPDNESPAERRLRRIKWMGWAAMIAVIASSGVVWAGKFGIHIGGAPPRETEAAPTAVVSPQETAPVERAARDTTPVAVAAKTPARREAAPAESTRAVRPKAAPAEGARPPRQKAEPAATPALASRLPAREDSAEVDEGAIDSLGKSPSEERATDSAVKEDIADVRARAAEALAQLDREKRRNQAAAATAALDSQKRRRAAAAPAAGAGQLYRAEAVATPPAPPTLEQRAQIYLRIGLDEASRQLGGPAHVIEGMSPVFMGLAQGGTVAGADGTRPVVRVVYQDAQGRLIMLDQQRMRPGQPAPQGSQLAWSQGDIAMWLNGEVKAEVLRTVRPRVR